MFYVEFTTKKGEKMKCRINGNDCLNTMDRQEIVDTIWRIILGEIPPQEEIKIKKYDVQYLKGIVKRLKVFVIHLWYFYRNVKITTYFHFILKC